MLDAQPVQWWGRLIQTSLTWRTEAKDEREKSNKIRDAEHRGLVYCAICKEKRKKMSERHDPCRGSRTCQCMWTSGVHYDPCELVALRSAGYLWTPREEESGWRSWLRCTKRTLKSNEENAWYCDEHKIGRSSSSPDASHQEDNQQHWRCVISDKYKKIRRSSSCQDASPQEDNQEHRIKCARP
jgi:hypothetical protein